MTARRRKRERRRRRRRRARRVSWTECSDSPSPSNKT